MSNLVHNKNDNCQNCSDCCVRGCFKELKCAVCACCCETLEYRVGPNQCLAYGTIMARKSGDNCYYQFDPNNDALDVPVGFLRHNVVTDENGRIKGMTSPIIGDAGCGPFGANIYFEGTFRTCDIKGNLAAAMAHPAFARLIQGTLSNGLVKLV